MGLYHLIHGSWSTLLNESIKKKDGERNAAKFKISDFTLQHFFNILYVNILCCPLKITQNVKNSLFLDFILENLFSSTFFGMAFFCDGNFLD